MKIKRICIFPHDISILTGKSLKSARELYNNLKVHLKKERHQYVTFREFADYAGIPYDELEH